MVTTQKTDFTRKINIAILFVFLFVRIIVDFFVNIIWSPAQIPAWYDYAFTFGTYLLATLAIWLNQYHLASLNIDKPFIIIFILVGIVISIYYVPPILGAIIWFLCAIVGKLLLSGKFDFEQPNLNIKKTIRILVIGLSPYILLFVVIHFFLGIKNNGLSTALYHANLPIVTIEEIIFRSLLWAYLRDQQFNDVKIVYGQAFLFWFAHLADYWHRPFALFFWIIWLALWLGILVRTSKSLTSSVIGHFLANVFSLLV